MRPADRLTRSLFVALAVGLGWGIRGDFGHFLGASFPGAALGLGFAFVAGQSRAFRWMPVLGALAALGIATGGLMSYGILHGYAKADTVRNYAYGFFTLILEGGAWGTFGCGLLGLVLEQERLKVREWLVGFLSIVVSGLVFGYLVVNVLGFHINPPRSDLSITFTGAALGWMAWLALAKKWYGLRGALLGYLGFGIGMAFARLLANASYLQPYPVNHWNIMEVGAGFFGGLVFTYGMLGREFPEAPRGKAFSIVSVCSCFYVLGLIPLLHRLMRLRPEKKLEEWSTALANYGYTNPEALSKTVLMALNAVCVLGFIAAAFWVYALVTGRERLRWFPVFALSGVMLLIQNLGALYFFYPRQEGSINMHFVFWVLLSGMAAYAVLFRPSNDMDPEEKWQKVPWLRWLATGLAVYVFILVAAFFVNGEKTMASANTRFPLWSWRDGPFPGNVKTP